MKIIKLGDKFQAESHTPGEFYDIDPYRPSCSCPHFLYRLAKNKQDCKHIKAVKEFLSRKKDRNYDKLVKELNEKHEADTIDLLDKYGKLVEDLLEKGELVEKDGKISILK